MPEELINPDAADLLSKILEKDPAKRITIPDIREHVWFKTRDTPVHQATGIFVGYSSVDYDTKVLDMMEKNGEYEAGFEREHIIRCLDANKHN